jgi:hypothetical protein
MTVTIDLPKEVEARLLSEAEASGVPFGQLVKERRLWVALSPKRG